jgi:hypothetical protein
MRASSPAPAAPSNSVMLEDERAPSLSPAVMARMAGVLYLVIVAGGAWAQLGVRDGLVVAGDASATARNIAGHELLYRVGSRSRCSTCCAASR